VAKTRKRFEIIKDPEDRMCSIHSNWKVKWETLEDSNRENNSAQLSGSFLNHTFNRQLQESQLRLKNKN
jgi:hypothetical protein